MYISIHMTCPLLKLSQPQSPQMGKNASCVWVLHLASLCPSLCMHVYVYKYIYIYIYILYIYAACTYVDIMYGHILSSLCPRYLYEKGHRSSHPTPKTKPKEAPFLPLPVLWGHVVWSVVWGMLVIKFSHSPQVCDFFAEYKATFLVLNSLQVYFTDLVR